MFENLLFIENELQISFTISIDFKGTIIYIYYVDILVVYSEHCVYIYDKQKVHRMALAV